MTLADLPKVNACLNAFSATCLVAGLVFIRRKNKEAHRACMIAALVASTIFLGCYLTYHFTAGITRFAAGGWPRRVYFTILLTHTPLAAVILPLIIITLTFALRGKFDRHKRIARWTWPIWMYVSLTGVLIYLMLYQWFPSR
ncbi:MAG: DUF420 domain-containing protein [Verrucomicrobia bacterium]|nr:DUF420 domain-containing protein [Verrucomicrobiota bacterium]